ncbi:ATP-binding protein [Nocardia amamiensis]|uniref:ATP-binding protein n=1 Tax=Nocardia amamiensis TaxID=404578 RepID=UPI0033F7F4D7
MRKEEVLAFIESGEGQQVEFKETTSAVKEATRTLAAFGSQPQGGVVIFGVKDDGTFHPSFRIGSDTSERLAGSIKANTLSMTTAQPLMPAIYAFTKPDLLVVEVSADMSSKGPYLAYGYRWQRAGASTHKVQMDYKQLARVYRHHLTDIDAEDRTAAASFGLRFCPECGGQNFQGAEYVDRVHDEIYYIIRCAECEWTDWSQ